MKKKMRLIKECHKQLEHRSVEAVYYELKKKWYWPGIKKTIENELRQCRHVKE